MILDDHLYIAHRIDRAAARRHCPRLTGLVLDVGCGRQPYRDLLPPQSSYVGMEVSGDVSPDLVGSVLDLPVRSESVDAVICTQVLEHVPEPARGVAEMHRVLRPGGKLYVTVPQSWGLHYEPHDYFRFTKYGVAYLLERAGFRIRAIEQMGGLFSYAVVRLIDLAATAWFGLCDRIGLRRGRYRIAALAALPVNLLARPLIALDRIDRLNPYGWAVLAEKPAPSQPPGP